LPFLRSQTNAHDAILFALFALKVIVLVGDYT
jgi:hypothetical protein